MPLYEYRCPECGAVFEELVRLSDRQAPPCPACGGRQAQKTVSAVADARGLSGSAPLAGAGTSACAGSGGFS